MTLEKAIKEIWEAYSWARLNFKDYPTSDFFKGKVQGLHIALEVLQFIDPTFDPVTRHLQEVD